MLMKVNCSLRGFLSWLYLLVLAGDTVLLSTIRHGMAANKLSSLSQFCDYYQAVISESKKIIVINGNEADHTPFHVEEVPHSEVHF